MIRGIRDKSHHPNTHMLHGAGIYQHDQHLPSKSPSFVGKYTSTIEHLGNKTPDFYAPNMSQLRGKSMKFRSGSLQHMALSIAAGVQEYVQERTVIGWTWLDLLWLCDLFTSDVVFAWINFFQALGIQIDYIDWSFCVLIHHESESIHSNCKKPSACRSHQY